MTRAISLLTVAAALIAAGCATTGDIDTLHNQLEETKSRTVKLEKEVAGVRTEALEGMEIKLRNYQKDLEQLRKTAADSLQDSLEGLKVDIRSVNGSLDSMTQQMKKDADELALFREDSDRRSTSIEKRVEKIEKSVDELIRQVAEIRSREAEKSPDAIYQKGIDSYKAGDYTKSREQLSRFIEMFPKHELTANAHYWLGETYYSEKVYDQAILEFEKVVKEFPAKGKAPAALLKQAMAFRELDDAKSARFVYKKLIENYPLSDEANAAKEKLKELK